MLGCRLRRRPCDVMSSVIPLPIPPARSECLDDFLQVGMPPRRRHGDCRCNVVAIPPLSRPGDNLASVDVGLAAFALAPLSRVPAGSESAALHAAMGSGMSISGRQYRCSRCWGGIPASCSASRSVSPINIVQPCRATAAICHLLEYAASHPPALRVGWVLMGLPVSALPSLWHRRLHPVPQTLLSMALVWPCATAVGPQES